MCHACNTGCDVVRCCCCCCLFSYLALISKDVFFKSATKISQDLNPDCRLSWYASVYCSCLERHSRLFLWTSERRRKCVLIAEKKRHKEGGRMKRRVDSWSPSVSLKGGDSEQQWGGSRHTEREGESERHTDRGVCVVSVDVIGCLCVCVTERDQQKAERVDTTPHDWLHLDSRKESTQPQ